LPQAPIVVPGRHCPSGEQQPGHVSAHLTCALPALPALDVPPLDVPPLDVPPLDVPPLDVPPLDVPPLELPAPPPLPVPVTAESSTEPPQATATKVKSTEAMAKWRGRIMGTSGGRMHELRRPVDPSLAL